MTSPVEHCYRRMTLCFSHMEYGVQMNRTIRDYTYMSNMFFATRRKVQLKTFSSQRNPNEIDRIFVYKKWDATASTIANCDKKKIELHSDLTVATCDLIRCGGSKEDSCSILPVYGGSKEDSVANYAEWTRKELHSRKS